MKYRSWDLSPTCNLCGRMLISNADADTDGDGDADPEFDLDADADDDIDSIGGRSM